ncbi:hypothetical protein DKX38_013335 [Salix brachista]|uniref:Sieve element occlusion C-terminal domain-containing protein n=1 Tax=Salix brachista TaxID=2182728 RepID=A0A5N5LR47_9ROSI|nr:hypothetical protein DKX38_013335 [Salix brachista]
MAVVPQNTRRERNMFAESDDSTMMKLIQGTHYPNGREFSVKPLLHIVEHVFLCATPAPGITNFEAQLDELKEKVLQNDSHKMMDMLSYTISKISCQMSSKCYGGGDAHETTMEILNLVSSYSWDAKVALALAAFAVTYGEFWLVTQLYLPSPLAGVDQLRRKSVLLLISDLELSHEELSMLEQLYSEAREQPGRPESQYEIVWLPVVDRSTPWNETKEKMFETFQSMMPWYSVLHPSLLDVAVIRYIKEMWHFNKKALIVVLDPQGKVVNPNAFHMTWIWGSLAFPFSSSREEALWKEENWNIQFLVDDIDPSILSWIEQGKFICLYGGEDIEWIRKFTAKAKAVAKDARIQLEMVYIGKSNPGENVRKINGWRACGTPRCNTRAADNDSIMKEIMTMLSFDGSDQGWAVISKGSDEMAKARGDTILRSFVEFESWKKSAEEKGFLPALIDHLHLLHSPSHCNRLILPGATGSIPERIGCAECGRPMEKFLIVREMLRVGWNGSGFSVRVHGSMMDKLEKNSFRFMRLVVDMMKVHPPTTIGRRKGKVNGRVGYDGP